MRKHLLAPMAALCLVACTTAEPSIRGLWKGTLKPDDGTPVPIEVSIQETGVETLAGTGAVTNDALIINFNSGAVFSGKFVGPNQPIQGSYIQPSNQVGGQRLAHSVALTPTGDGRWTGLATPLAREFSIFMNITEAKNKSLKAVMLNPERNITGPVKQYYFVGNERQDSFSLMNPRDNSEFTTVSFDRPNQQLTMNFGPISDLELHPVDSRSDASKAYFGDQDRVDLNLPSSNGVWPVGTIEEAGLNKTLLSNLTEKLSSSSGDEGQPILVHSLLVARGGKLVVEEYFRNHDRDMPHDIRSAGKTFASVLIGALIEEGLPLSANTPINQFVSIPNEDSQSPITLGHLLTHQSGLDCYDGDSSSPGGEDRMWQQDLAPNFWDFTSKLDFFAQPGTRYAYCSGGINLVGAALAGASDETVLSLLETRLFEPLGFKNAYWNVMPNGDAYLGGGAQLRTRDLLKIGQLYLSGGKWLGTQLIDSEWVADSTRPKVEITPQTTGLDEAAFNRFYFGGVDGYAWHLHPITVGQNTYETYEASGNGGQMVVVVPELDLVVGITGGNYMEGFVWGQWRQEIVGDGIIRSLNP